MAAGTHSSSTAAATAQGGTPAAVGRGSGLPVGESVGLLRRRRRANADGGREASHRVRVTAEESAQLTALADAQGITVVRLLVESALAGDREIASQRRDAIGQVFALRRLLAAVSNNLNQVARHANATGEMPADAVAVVAAIRRLVPRLSAAAESLAVNPPRRKPLTDSRQALLSDRPTEEALEASAAAWGEVIGAAEDDEAAVRAAAARAGADGQPGEGGRR